MAGWATSQSWACTTSGRHGRSVGLSFNDNPARTMAWPMANVQAIMSLEKLNSCGSCAAATTRTSSLISSDDGGVLGAVPGGRGGGGAHPETIAPGAPQPRRQVVDVTTEPADHHRRVLPGHHQNFHHG